MVDKGRRLLALDFIAECGDLIASFGAAIAAAASAERLDVLELALHHARSALFEGITEFKSLNTKEGGAE